MNAIRLRPLPPLLACLAAALTLACSGDSSEAPAASPSATISPSPTLAADSRTTLHGVLSLDGQPLEADFLGARVVRDGLTAACQAVIPAVTGGRYEIPVLADADHRGCGAPGAQIVLWTYTADRYFYTAETLPWPAGGGTAVFDATFSSSAPEGATLPATEIKGRLFDSAGQSLPDGAVIEAFVGDTRCGVTQLRDAAATEGYYTLIVAGPASVPGCDPDTAIAFRIDGAPAGGSAANDLAGPAAGQEVDLTLP